MTDQSNGDTHSDAVDPQGLLLILGDTLDDLEAARIAMANRLRALTTPEEIGENGGSFGKGIPADHPVAARLAGLLDALDGLEHQAELELKRTMRTHPLGPWVKRTIGVGEKQAARLLASIGDPTTRSTVSQLWAYCGYHVLHPGHERFDAQCPSAGADPSSNAGQAADETLNRFAGVAPSRQRGRRANWNAKAKSRAYLVAESCIKQAKSPYRATYDEARVKYVNSVHTHECKRCGPSGHPAPVGSPLNAGHQHARAMRIVAKAILRDIWVEARRATGDPTPITLPSDGPHPGSEAVA